MEIPKNKIKIFFDAKIITLLLKIDKKIPDLASKKITAKNLALSPKNEFHLTIIGRATGENILKILQNLNKTKQQLIIKQIRKLSKETEWKIKLKNKFFYIKKNYTNTKGEATEKRESIIQLAKIDGLKEFYQKINIFLNTKIDPPFPHLTLYATSNKTDKKLRGIGIYSKNQFTKLKPKQI